MKIELVAANMRNNKVSQQIREMEEYLSSNKCDLLCFGEAYLHGFDGMTWDYETDLARAISLESPVMEEIKGLARKYDCGISFGYIEKLNENIYSSNIVIDSQGSIVDNYRRISEGWKDNWEDGRYSQGQNFQVFEFKNKKFLTAICGDFWWDHLIKEMEAYSKDLDAIIWPLYIDYSPEAWRLEARQEYSDQLASISCPVLMINSYSKGENEGKGGCCLFNHGSVEKELAVGERGVLLVDI